MVRTGEGPAGEPFLSPESALTLAGLAILLGGEGTARAVGAHGLQSESGPIWGWEEGV